MKKIKLIKCNKCGELYNQDFKHKCNNIRLAAYQQGKTDMLEEIRLQTKDNLIMQMLFGILINKSSEEIEQLRKEIEKGQK